MRRAFLGWALGCTIMAGSAGAQTPMARPSYAEPSLSADGGSIAFASGGDIWEVPAAGGIAHVLVSGPASEGRPLYSPDGRRLAFTSTRGGSNNIFVLDLASGAVTRLTYAEANEELDSWSADGQWIYFASSAGDVGRQSDVFRVAAGGGTPMEVSREAYLAEYQAAPSPDGQSLVLAARGLSNGQWWRHGSSHIDQNELWMKPIATDGGYRKLAGDASRHAWPMWEPSGASIVYMSDAGGAENLWRLATAEGAQPTPLTRFTDGRLLYPTIARDGSAILFERDAQIWRADARTGAVAAIRISLRGAPAADGMSHLSFANWSRLAASPDGEKIALIGHGELFAASAKDGGPGQRITTSVGAEREVRWSPDSKRLLYVTERGTEHLLAEYDVASGRETMLTANGVASVPTFAPDGKSIAYVLNDRQLRRLTPARGKQPKTDQLLFEGWINSDARDGPGPAWSPDGAWIAFARFDAKSFSNVMLVPAAGGTPRPVSFLANGQMSAIRWSGAGDYLLIDSGQRAEESRIIRIDLTPHVPKYKEDMFRKLFTDKPPGAPASAPVEKKGSGKTADKGAAPAKAAATPVSIAWDGLRDRATILPVGLNASVPLVSADGKTLIFIASSRGQDNIYSYNLDELADEPPVAQQITQSAKPKSDLSLSADGKTLFFLEGGKPMSTPIDTPKPKAIAIGAEMDVDFTAEKQVVFDEAWSVLDRRFYDAGFNGQDWTALKARFEPLVAGAKTPDELRRVINLMIGELNASHSGINRPAAGPGSLPTDRVGQLGLKFERAANEAGRGLVVREVVPLGPAAIAGIKAGDRLTAIDGSTIGPTTNLDQLLENKVGKRVALSVSGRQAIVRPISQSSIAGLRYRAWVDNRRALVERVSGGRLGYVHMLDMSEDSLNQLYLDLDADNQAKAGVVVDLRNNNGGFVNGHAIDVFARRNYLTMFQRGGSVGVPSRHALGQRALGVPTVLVTNESSLSDAEDFTEGYRALGLGKVVGQPTAGWIIFTGSEALIDGSSVRLPGYRIRDGRGQDMENNPRPVDIRVERPLGETASGRDAQLEAAVSALLAQVR